MEYFNPQTKSQHFSKLQATPYVTEGAELCCYVGTFSAERQADGFDLFQQISEQVRRQSPLRSQRLEPNLGNPVDPVKTWRHQLHCSIICQH